MDPTNPFLSLNKPKDPNEWNDKLIGKVILDNDEETALTVDEVSSLFFTMLCSRLLNFCPFNLAVHTKEGPTKSKQNPFS
jgi:hypothetical protein